MRPGRHADLVQELLPHTPQPEIAASLHAIFLLGGGHPAVVSCLIEAGADINLQRPGRIRLFETMQCFQAGDFNASTCFKVTAHIQPIGSPLCLLRRPSALGRVHIEHLCLPSAWSFAPHAQPHHLLVSGQCLQRFVAKPSKIEGAVCPYKILPRVMQLITWESFAWTMRSGNTEYTMRAPKQLLRSQQ